MARKKRDVVEFEELNGFGVIETEQKEEKNDEHMEIGPVEVYELQDVNQKNDDHMNTNDEQKKDHFAYAHKLIMDGYSVKDVCARLVDIHQAVSEDIAKDWFMKFSGKPKEFLEVVKSYFAG